VTEPGKPLRVLFCGAVLQSFFDLPGAQIPMVLQAAGLMTKTIREMPGVTVLGTMDDDITMVGTSPNGWPWTFYILADCADHDTVGAACNVFRTIEVGEHRLWRYMRVEARIGRELVMPEPA
jgi:hypothetical protein